MNRTALKCIALTLICVLMCVVFSACDLNDGAVPNNEPNFGADNEFSNGNIQAGTIDGNNSQNINEGQQPSSDINTGSTDKGYNNSGNESSSPSEGENEGNIPFVPPTPQYARVDEKYDEVMRPFKAFAQQVVDDLVSNGIINVPQEATIDSLRYFYGRAISISVRVVPYIYDTDEYSDFLYVRSFVELDDFGCEFEEWCEYRDFLIEERECEGKEDYVDAMLPIATKIAGDLTAKYREYVESNGYEKVRCGVYDEPIVLKSDSYLHETHDLIIERMNERLSDENLPLLSDEEILVYLQGTFVDGVAKCNKLNVNVKFQNYYYKFSFDFNDNDEFDTNWLLSFKAESDPGYSDPADYLNLPGNEAYAELFGTLRIQEMDFFSCELYTLISENTFLYF